MYQLKRKESVSFLQASALEPFDFLTHAFCTRHQGVSQGPYAGLNMSPLEGDDPENIRTNWQLLSRAFAIPEERFFRLHQVHGDGILVLNGTHSRSPFHDLPAYDAIVTNQPGQALCIRTADCVPVFLVDPEKGIIANIHAGWKGTSLNIAGKVVRTMRERFGSRVEQLVGVIGPAIGPCCYEVDEPVVRAIGSWGRHQAVCCPSVSESRWMLDLPAINREQLVRSGIPAGNMTVMNLCTSCREDLFFSHRRDRGKTGRQVHFIMIRDEIQRSPDGSKKT